MRVNFSLSLINHKKLFFFLPWFLVCCHYFINFFVSLVKKALVRRCYNGVRKEITETRSTINIHLSQSYAARNRTLSDWFGTTTRRFIASSFASGISFETYIYLAPETCWKNSESDFSVTRSSSEHVFKLESAFTLCRKASHRLIFFGLRIMASLTNNIKTHCKNSTPRRFIHTRL